MTDRNARFLDVVSNALYLVALVLLGLLAWRNR